MCLGNLNNVMVIKLLPCILLSLLISCTHSSSDTSLEEMTSNYQASGVELVILGNVQDAGSPHIGCIKDCCKDLFAHPDVDRKVVSLGLLDHKNKKQFLFEATPDITSQIKMLKNLAGRNGKELPDVVFLTHAHIGHYAGLMYFGKEAINAPSIPVYAMPRMQSFLEQNGPWSQLVSNKNIEIFELQNGQEISVTNNIKIMPIVVPHRDEYSETVGYRITGPQKSVLFIPDIDKWEKWEENIIKMIASVDYALLDATFFDGKEISNRDISQIPHPFVIESMSLLANLTDEEKSKVHFIHFNHTNPLLSKDSEASKQVIKKGFKVARLGLSFDL